MAAALGIVLLMAPLSPVFEPHKAHAAATGSTVQAIVTGGLGTIQETVSAGANLVSAGADKISAFAESKLGIKEFALDGIAFDLINIAIEEIAASIIRWINSGFQGSPAFVTDLQALLINIADGVAGDFIYSSNLDFICSPFELNVRLALELQYTQGRGLGYQPQCRLSEVINNIEGFFAGDFLAGGWDGFIQLNAVPGNNPYGAFLGASHEMEIAIRNAEGRGLRMLDFGQGFLSYERCLTTATGERECSISTPGQVIEERLNASLGLSENRLMVADEINEIIGALFAQLARQAIAGVGGLLGLTQPAYAGGRSFIARLQNDSEIVGFRDTSQNPIRDALETQRRWRSLNEEVVALVERMRAYADARCTARTAPPLPEDAVEAEARSLEHKAEADATISTLTDVYEREQAADDARARAAAYEEYLALEAEGALYTEIDISTMENDVATLTRGVEQYEQNVNDACR